MSATLSPLWPQPIPIIGGTGKPGAGKTRFGVSICPGPQTLVYDLEQSSLSYSYIGFERIDVQKEMHKLYPKGYQPKQLWEWWLNHARALPSDKYRVIMVDPATDLERGLTDWVNENPKFFGHTSGQYSSMSGIMWGDVKDYWKMILADMTARCETFYFTAHVGQDFAGGSKPTGKLKVKGKETLLQLASLYLWFERDADGKTGEKPKVPSAIVMKGRLEIGEVIDGDVVSYEVLPPRLPVATPKAVRDYFKNPIGKVGLKDAERAKEEVLSADERLALEVRKAEAERDAAMIVADKAAAKSETTAQPVASGSTVEKNGDGKPHETAFKQLQTRVYNCTDIETLRAVAGEANAAATSGKLNGEEVQQLKADIGSHKAVLSKSS